MNEAKKNAKAVKAIDDRKRSRKYSSKAFSVKKSRLKMNPKRITVKDMARFTPVLLTVKKNQ